MQWLFDRLIPAAQAHEKWFVSSGTAPDVRPEWYLQLNAATAAVVLGAVAVLSVGVALDRAYARTRAYAWSERVLAPFRAAAPRVLSVCLGLSLAWSAWQGVILADNLPLSPSISGIAFQGAEFALGAMLVLGVFSAEAGLLVAALFGALFALFPWTEPFDYLYFPVAGFFVFVFSPDGALGRRCRAALVRTERDRRSAYLLLRLCTGASLIILAMGKLLDPGLHFGLMDAYPDFNPYTILSSLGIIMSREAYVFALFAGEILTGIAVFVGIFQRVLGLLLIPLFTVSVLFLGPLEIVGHLPLIGILFAFFAFGDRYVPLPDAAAAEKGPPA